jgi:hypothetical protein
MPLPKLPKSSITGAIYTRGGSLIGGQLLPDDGLIVPPPGSVVQNPDQAAKVSVATGRAAARAGGFGPRSRAAYKQYNDPSINPQSQAPGAPISNRPLVPIEDRRGEGGVGAANKPPRISSPTQGSSNPSLGYNRPRIEIGAPAASMASSSGTAFRGATVMRGPSVTTTPVATARPAAAPAATVVKATPAASTGIKKVVRKPLIAKGR